MTFGGRIGPFTVESLLRHKGVPARFEVGSIETGFGRSTMSHSAGKEIGVHRTLIVARMKPDEATKVADIFAESDASELPQMIGVSRRMLFRFHDLYFHLVEADADIQPDLYKARAHPLYARINEQLSHHISPYDPNWREPKDAMAVPFYLWEAQNE